VVFVPVGFEGAGWSDFSRELPSAPLFSGEVWGSFL
jgi:hypothetical protein